MKKKTLALILTLCMTVTAVVSFTAGAAAAGSLQEIKAYLNAGVTIKVDGEEKIITESNGVRTYPIMYHGTNYVPIRSVANLLGVDVDWDQKTNSILLGKQPSGVDLIETYAPYNRIAYGGAVVGQVRAEEGRTEDISGVTYSHWIVLEARFNPGTSSIAYNLQGKHETLTFTYYGYNQDSTLRVLGDDGMMLGEFPITAGALAKTVTLPLFHTKELRFEVDIPAAFSGVKIMDVCLDAEE